jgi:hypothetical protein
VHWWAVGLLVFAVLGLSIDVQAGGLGPWTVIGTLSLIAGSLFLYGGAHLDVPWWVLILVIGLTVSVLRVGHDRCCARPFLDADSGARGDGGPDGNCRGVDRPRRHRDDRRRAVAGAHEPGDADRGG